MITPPASTAAAESARGDLRLLRFEVGDLPAGFHLVSEVEESGRSIVQVFAKKVFLGKSPMLWWQVGAFDDEDAAASAFTELLKEHERGRQSGLFRYASLPPNQIQHLFTEVGDLRSIEAIEIDGKVGIWAAVCDRNAVMKLSTLAIDATTSTQLLKRQLAKFPAEESVELRRRLRSWLRDVYPHFKMAESRPPHFISDYESLWGQLEALQLNMRKLPEWEPWTQGVTFGGHAGAILGWWTETCRLAKHYVVTELTTQLLEDGGVPLQTLHALRGYPGGVLGLLYEARAREGDTYDHERLPADFAVRPLSDQMAFFRKHIPPIVAAKTFPDMQVEAKAEGLPFPE